jgi:ABC-type glycerol-3-phosphate transport system substrate-binding protein
MLLASSLALALLLAACAGNGDVGTEPVDDTPVDEEDAADATDEVDDEADEVTLGEGDAGTVRFAWWGGEVRQQRWTEVAERFAEENPDLTVELEYADYDPFQDRFATQAAAGNAPDLFWIAGFNIMEFHTAGLYEDLEPWIGEELDLSAFPDDVIDSWRLDGELLQSEALPRLS